MNTDRDKMLIGRFNPGNIQVLAVLGEYKIRIQLKSLHLNQGL